MLINSIQEPIKKWFNKDEKVNETELPNISSPEAIEVDENNISWDYSFDVVFKGIKQLIKTYREIALTFEISLAIDEIINEAVILENNNVIGVNLDKTDFSDNIKKKIINEFDHIVSLLDFNNIGDEYFRKWYIDGRIYFQDIVDLKNPSKGILKIKLLSPLDIFRYKDVKTKKSFYVWKLDDSESCKRNRLGGYYGKDADNQVIFKVPEQLITYAPSGLTNEDEEFYISYLHKSIKPLNQLTLIEDSAVIYRLTRAPERRVFYIDVGKLPKKKAEAYVKKLINKFKNKISYDSTTGKVNQSKNTMTLLEDFYIPRTSTQQGTEIDNISNGALVDKVEDIQYFKKKLYKSLNVPTSRIDKDESPVVNLGQSGEITREELKFSKFIKKLQSKFGFVFLDCLKKQLILKKVININEWEDNYQKILLDWQQDSYFESLKEEEILRGRIETADALTEYVGKYFSHEYVQKHIFRMNDEDVEQQNKQIEKEKSNPKYKTEEE